MSAPMPLIYELRDGRTAATCCASFTVDPSEGHGAVTAALIDHLDHEHRVTIRAERLPYGFERTCELCPIVARPNCPECDGQGVVIEVMVDAR